jgi:hypothetical protein
LGPISRYYSGICSEVPSNTKKELAQVVHFNILLALYLNYSKTIQSIYFTVLAMEVVYLTSGVLVATKVKA